MTLAVDRPLWVQSDRTILFEVGHALSSEVQDFLPRFAELEKSPERFHTYRVTPLSLWNAAAVGVTVDEILDFLNRMSREPAPGNVVADIQDFLRRWGLLRLVRRPAGLALESRDAALLADFVRSEVLSQWTTGREPDGALLLRELARGEVKQTLLKLGYPVDDLAGYTPGAHYEFKLRASTARGRDLSVRPYQRVAADLFYSGGSERGGSGVIVLPCGAGKTMVAMAVMERLQCETLVLTTNTVAVRQWQDELFDKTHVPREDIGEYTGDKKQIRPITISTYQILTHRKSKGATPFTHFGIFAAKDWGLIVYDEVHLLPAPIFRMTADLQARRRIGLTATLIREDGREGDVFSLIGPKRYDAPWKDIEAQGYIAPADCVEVRVTLPEGERFVYATAEPDERYRLASCTGAKTRLVEELVSKHRGEPTLVIGQYIDQLDEIGARLDAPVIKGETPVKERQRLFDAFRHGEVKLLVVSKVANFSIDLPSAEVAIQVSGSFGSRQEEAQRLGRLLRPKEEGKTAHFYTVVSRDTVDAEFAQNRQRFLAEQGYAYRIIDAEAVERGGL